MEKIKEFLLSNNIKNYILYDPDEKIENKHKEKQTLSENADKFIKAKGEIQFLIENGFNNDDNLMNDLIKKGIALYKEIENKFFDLNWNLKDLYKYDLAKIISLLILFGNEEIQKKLKDFISNNKDKLLKEKLQQIINSNLKNNIEISNKLENLLK